MLKVFVLSRKHLVSSFIYLKVQLQTLKTKSRMQSEPKTVPNRIAILWFRNDLRLVDNSILNDAIDLLNKKKLDFVVPFYCFDRDTLEGKSRLLKIPR